jgi:hypothetical protein
MANIPDAFKLKMGGPTAVPGTPSLSQQEVQDMRKQAAALWQALDDMVGA